VKMKWAKVNPAAIVEGKGRHRHGKPQLRIDEARKWLDVAMRMATTAESEYAREGAVKAMMTLGMGLRECEVLRREVRDVDDGGCLLWVPDTKTDAGRRTQEVPISCARSSWHRRRAGRQRRRFQISHERCGAEVGEAHLQEGRRDGGGRAVDEGLHATLAVDKGITSHAVAAALGHKSFTTTARSYAKVEAVEGAKQRRVIATLTGKSSQANGSGVRPLEHGKLHNFLHNFSGSGSDVVKGEPGK